MKILQYPKHGVPKLFWMVSFQLSLVHCSFGVRDFEIRFEIANCPKEHLSVFTFQILIEVDNNEMFFLS